MRTQSPQIAGARAYVEEINDNLIARFVAEEPGLGADTRITFVASNRYQMAGEAAGHAEQEPAEFIKSGCLRGEHRRFAAGGRDMEVEQQAFAVVGRNLPESIRNRRRITV